MGFALFIWGHCFSFSTIRTHREHGGSVFDHNHMSKDELDEGQVFWFLAIGMVFSEDESANFVFGIGSEHWD